MKKFITLLLAMTLALVLAACGTDKETENKDGIEAIKLGVLNSPYMYEILGKHLEEKHPEQAQEDAIPQTIEFDTLSSMLLALDKGDINVFMTNKNVGDYLLAHNDKYEIDSEAPVSEDKIFNFSMVTSDTNAELHSILDGAIKQLKDDGTIDKLIEEDLNAYIEKDPKPAELPYFEGAETYKIAVTGDVPPMDFVTADGKAAGFNVALLTEIANIAEVNFELVQIDAGASTSSLESGKIDALFWMVNRSCFVCGEAFDTSPEGTLITESYFTDQLVYIKLKEK